MSNGQPEVFTSLQGEGVTLGLPSVFVRLSACNLRCTWCDTKYTWDWANYLPAREVIGLEVPTLLESVLSAGPHNVVITGGEPLLQQRALVPLVAGLKEAGRRIEVETNGTVLPEPPLTELIDQWNVSPKLESSGNDCTDREAPAPLAWFGGRPHAFFKFVIVGLEDVDEAVALAHRYGMPRDHVLLMPEGTDSQTLMDRSTWLVERAQALGVRYTTRLHILLWGDERGK